MRLLESTNANYIHTGIQINQESLKMMGSQELLLDRRNLNWIPVMESAMKNSSTFFAVGAGH